MVVGSSEAKTGQTATAERYRTAGGVDACRRNRNLLHPKGTLRRGDTRARRQRVVVSSPVNGAGSAEDVASVRSKRDLSRLMSGNRWDANAAVDVRLETGLRFLSEPRVDDLLSV
jgi:hypothetical protein